MAGYADRHNERIAKMGKAGGFGKRRRVSRRGAPDAYSAEARAARMAEARRGACHSLARADMNGPRRTVLFGEIWQKLKNCNDLLDWQFCGFIADALEDDWPNEVVYVALDTFATAGWLAMRERRAGAREYRLIGDKASDARKYIDLTGDFGLDIAGAQDE